MSTRLSSHKPLVVVDDAIPFIEGMLEPWFDVKYLEGKAISSDDLRNAAALLVRTRTKCNAELLDNTSVEFIGTATIGTDHIDFNYCRSRDIETVCAPGCNSGGVCQYVFSALRQFGISRGTLGVIGTGHVGSKVVDRGLKSGFRVLCNDIAPSCGTNTSLDDLLAQSDIVTIHIPLKSVEGKQPIYDNNSFADEAFFSKMKNGAAFINASRGEVVDDEAFLAARHRLGKVALDVWRNEPDIDTRMLAAADISTPHVAGYSIQGKINGTQAVVRALGCHFNIPDLIGFSVRTKMPPVVPYNIMDDDAALRNDPSSFEFLRSHYRYRDDSL